MRLLARLRHWLRAVFRRGAAERELNAELRFHLEEETKANVRAGLAPEEARSTAARDFGGLAQVQERCRDAWGVRLVDQVRQDLGYAWRGLGRNPGFTAAALATLALGIGASTTMFSVVQAVVLRPLPYHEPERLMTVWSEVQRRGVQQAPSGYANIEDWRRSSRTLSGLAAWDGTNVVIEEPSGEARSGGVALVSANLFEVLGVGPWLGRTFTADEAARREGLVVISHAAWQQHYDGSVDAIGRNLVVNGRPAQIIGVMPPGFHFPGNGDGFWMPETLTPNWEEERLNRGTDSWRVVARLAPGASLEAVRSELAGIAAVLERNFPAENTGLGVRVVPLSLQVTGRPLRLALFTLVGAVTAVLLIACSNVANLLLARGAARQREFAVREALGASRGRIVGQLLLESALLAALAAATGAGLAGAALRSLRAFGPGDIPRLNEVSIDGLALSFAVGLSFASVMIFGLAPALRSTRGDPMDMLRSVGRGISEGRIARRLRAALVVAEFALAIVLLITAGLLVRSFVRLTAVDTGFRADNALVVGLLFPRHRPVEQIAPFAQQVVERVSALPGVRAAGMAEDVLLGLANEQVITVEGAAMDQGGVIRLPLNIDAITPDFFRAVGVPLLRGRFFTDGDGAQSPGVVIVNETLARRIWPNEDAVGKRIRNDGPDSGNPWLTVVGVVADLRRQGPEHPPVAQAFQPYTQRPSRGGKLVVAADIEPTRLAANVRAIVAEVDRSVPISGVTTLRQELTKTLAQREFNVGLIGLFSVIAITLAGIGIFGLMNYGVIRRTQEIGVRMALGAQPGDVLKMILTDGLKLALAGIAVGVALSATLMPVLRSLLFEVSFADPLSFGGAIALLVAIALLACYLPARRAVRVNPVSALRAE